MGENMCSVPGCERKSLSRQMCGAHYQRVTKGARITSALKPQRDVKDCSVPGCTAAYKAKGFCGSHYSTYRVGGVPGTRRGPNKPAKLDRFQSTSKICDVESCEVPSRSRGLCPGHYHQAFRYNLSMKQLNEISTQQDCPICLRKDVSLHVDHDHTCCDTPGSCGKCVRGFICAPCNVALGMLQDSPERLYRAAQYLTRENVIR